MSCVAGSFHIITDEKIGMSTLVAVEQSAQLAKESPSEVQYTKGEMTKDLPCIK